MRTSKRWQPIRDGDKYCAPACGAGCTYDQYEWAKQCGHALVAMLDSNNFKPRIWENLGWHYSATTKDDNHEEGDFFIQVYDYNQERQVKYWVDIQVGGRQYTGHFDCPNEGINSLMTQLMSDVMKMQLALNKYEDDDK